MKQLDNFYRRNIHQNPNKKLTPILLIGNIISVNADDEYDEDIFHNGIRNPNITSSDRELIGQYQDFTGNYIVAIGPTGGRLSFWSSPPDSDSEPVIDTLKDQKS